jgi:hypothetical protein
MAAEDDELVLREGVQRILGSRRAETIFDAEEIYLDEWRDEFVKLLDTPISNTELEAHPYAQLLLKHGMRSLKEFEADPMIHDRYK